MKPKIIKMTKEDLQNWLLQKLPDYKVEVISVKKSKKMPSKFKRLEIKFNNKKNEKP